MTIERARKIADRINNEKWYGFQTEALEALTFLTDHGNADDRKLAEFLIDAIT